MRFIGVAGQGTNDEMAEFVAEQEVNGFDHLSDVRGQLWAVFGVTAQPSYIFINDDGTIQRHIGGMEPADLVEQLDLLLAS